jgi:hypothetical protein
MLKKSFPSCGLPPAGPSEENMIHWTLAGAVAVVTSASKPPRLAPG